MAGVACTGSPPARPGVARGRNRGKPPLSPAGHRRKIGSMALRGLERLGTRRRRASLGFAAVGAWLVPWSGFLAATVPSTTAVRHWNVAWCGLDLCEASTALATAWLTARRDRRAPRAAAVLATLLCVDAWFDVCTAAPGRGLSVAIAEAVLLEIPLAAATAWWSSQLEAEVRRPAAVPGP